MKKLLARFAEDESGATAIEYGLIAGLIAICLITVVGYLTEGLDTMFNGIKTTLEENTPGG